MILDQRRSHWEGEAQRNKGINKNPRNVDSPFRFNERMFDEGSKIENSLVIIFKVFHSKLVWG